MCIGTVLGMTSESLQGLEELKERMIDMTTWNFGIVGAGLIADFHARAIGDLPNAKFVGCCDKIAERSEQLAAKYGAKSFATYEEMVQSDDINIVTIATPSGFHLEPTIAAAKANKHVICEKPVEITLAEGAARGDQFGSLRDDQLRGDLRALVADGRVLQGFVARDVEAGRRRCADEPVDPHGGHAVRRDAAHRIGAGLHRRHRA